MNDSPVHGINNDSDESSTKDSRIARELSSGTYVIEATLATTTQATDPRNFTLKISVADAIPLLGHQADFTIQYVKGDLTPGPTPTPASTPVGPTPGPLHEPAVVIPTAISEAVSAWNVAVATPWPHVLFCERNSCESRSHDDETSVIIDMEDGDGNQRNVISPILTRHCGRTFACVKPDPVTFLWNLNPPGNGHMGNLRMVIEQPAWAYTSTMGFLGLQGTHTRYVWTNEVSEQNTHIYDDTYLLYLPSVVMHEFGHTAGLTDLYDEKYNDKYTGYLMDDTHGFTAIPQLDIDYLIQVYRNEHGAKPHDK